ncbi:metal ABC transporter permease [Membranihabitans marinus]|uniref:metal ABC transporter permease n=1 Tax=Membranihabitans marinus TaxID=1227546 RepID=UPI001F013D86|nr:iron chelate uptake ABC transporter family permease subunit [Membranihabitans marinus]
MNEVLDFLLLREPNILYVVIGTILIGASAGLIGTFAFLKKSSLLGDAISHAALPGVCIGFLFAQEKDPVFLLLGSFISGWIATYLVEWITIHSKLKKDTAIAVILSFFFGIGIFLLTIIQGSGMAAQSGLNTFLVGKAAAIQTSDLLVFGGVALLIILFVVIYYQPLKILVFNRDYALSIGLPVKTMEFLLNSAIVMAIAVGIQAVGVILMAALLITPAAAARFWSYRLSKLLIIAAGIGGFSGWFGALVSYTAPNMPTGPWIVTVLSVFAMGSAFLAPKSGMISRIKMGRENANKILVENILKTIYLFCEKEANPLTRSILYTDILEQRFFTPNNFSKGLRWLDKKHMIILDKNSLKLTEQGYEESKRVVRLHRLWEVYLYEKMNLAADHIHPNAETMEHVLTPDLEKLLLKELDHPMSDPHQSKIPK